MVKEYFLYKVNNNCLFQNKETDFIETLVLAKNEYDAKNKAKEFLLSEDNIWKIKDVVGQRVEASSSFIADVGIILK